MRERERERYSMRKHQTEYDLYPFWLTMSSISRRVDTRPVPPIEGTYTRVLCGTYCLPIRSTVVVKAQFGCDTGTSITVSFRFYELYRLLRRALPSCKTV